MPPKVPLGALWGHKKTIGDICLNFQESVNFDATAWWDPPGSKWLLIFWWLWEGVAVERGCGRHWKNSYNACKIRWGSQAKMVSKCNRIASLVILNDKIFPNSPYETGGQPPSRPLPPSCRRYSVNTNGVQWPYHFLPLIGMFWLHEMTSN